MGGREKSKGDKKDVPETNCLCWSFCYVWYQKEKKKVLILMRVNKAVWRMDNEKWMSSTREVTNKNTKRNNIVLKHTSKQDLHGILVVTNLLYLKL